jgi:nitroreductase
LDHADELLELIRARRSVRRFRPEPPDRATLERLIEIATWAPTAGNRQDWLFTVVTAPALLGQMAEAVKSRWAAIIEANRTRGYAEGMERYAAAYAMFPTAPAVVIVSARATTHVQRHMFGEEADVTAGGAATAAMAAQTMMLAAQALGLSSCCMTGALVARAEIAKLAGLPRKQEIACLVALGQPDGDPPPAPARKALAEIAKFLE